ncbi:type III-A CRISPR-associated RAMP protein Csm5 [Methanocaldococcus indicus]|uniref:type III-A CRISPR-associated RAMP protein Csm5 n=1 Tax=Methanocaldococcus indicus TaxID=213231 RepID=UPI003C6D8768
MILKAELLSPIFIGCGDEYTQLDYYIENNKAKIVDLEKALQDLGDINAINEISELILQNTFGNRVEINAKELLEEFNLNPEDYVVKEIYSEIKSNSRTRVKKFITTNNSYYIPGSSIKGAIRTAYLFKYYDNHFSELLKIINSREIPIHEKGIAAEVKAIEGKINIKKGRIQKNIQNDFFKYLKVSDSLELTKKKFRFIQTKRLKGTRTTKGIPINLEAYYEGKFKFKIKVEDEFIKKVNEMLETNYKDGYELLKDICNNFSKTIVEYELNKRYNKEIINFYKDLLDEINNSNSIFLNLGFAGGFISKTLYLLFWKNDKSLSLFNTIKGFYLNLYKNNRNSFNAWRKARNYYEFPSTKTFYVRYIQSRGLVAKKPLGWIKIEGIE